ncbi:MAG: GTP cyclohydrolase I FolE [Clostridia bacterium]|nr:GTP cyclohydrolase I FolE [Clostridia bacterium]
MKVDRARIARAVREILEAIGEDPEREGLLETPERVADSLAELFSDVGQDPAEQMTSFFHVERDDLVIVRDIPFYSMCEHHLLPFRGKAHVAYIPSGGLITGISKLARVVESAARRPQLQERLTAQVADAIQRKLDPKGVLVVVEAEHLCMTMRGIRKPGSVTVTSAVRGVFAEQEATRNEAVHLLRADGWS